MGGKGSGNCLMPVFVTRRDGLEGVRRKLHRLTFDPMVMGEVEERVKGILEAVREGGDKALVEIERKVGWKGCTRQKLRVTEAEMDAAFAEIPPSILDALCSVRDRLERFHRHQLRTSWLTVEDGVLMGQLIRPIKRVGMYVPGGLAIYPSTVLHLAIPARVAGVKELYLATPPQENGMIAPLVLAAARLIGIDGIFRVGGAHAVAAFAYGTETIPKVDKIVGPGGLYPVIAKRLLYGVVGIDLLPGPSEVAVVADETAPPDWVALELLAQAEHGPDSVAFLFTPSRKLLRRVAEEINRRVRRSPRRQYLEPALREHGALVLTRDIEEAIALVNEGAFEHVALMVAHPMTWLERVQYAGSIFLGPTTSVVFGDYLAGPSHVLPTGGTARFSSGLSVDDFLIRSSVIMVTGEKAPFLSEATALLAESEGLPAHAQAVKVRR